MLRTHLSVFLLVGACAGEGSTPGPDGGSAPMPDGALPAPDHEALVELRLEPPLINGDPQLSIRGGFITVPDPRCQRTQLDACEISDCPEALIGNTYADPGKLAFEPSGGVVQFTPGASFFFFDADFIPWAANESITLSAAGKDAIPAFETTVKSPRTLDAGEGRPIHGPPIVTSQPFTATWVPINEDVLVELRQGRETPNGPFEIFVRCVVNGGGGSGTIPAAALAKFRKTASGGGSIQVSAHAMRSSRVIAGDFGVTFRVLRSFDELFFHDVQ